MISALIVAAGKGERFGGRIKKQFIEIAGRPIFLHSVDPFYKSKEVDEIIIIVPDDELGPVTKVVKRAHLVKKMIKIVPGGESRQDSVNNGLKVMDERAEYVLIHDGVRPFITVREVDRIANEVKENNAVIYCIPVRDTIVAEKENHVNEYVDREKIRFVQTPQAFKTGLIKKAFKHAYENGYKGTDESSVVKYFGEKVKLLPGSFENIKITTREDLTLAKILLQKR